jgi:hypothetical protein
MYLYKLTLPGSGVLDDAFMGRARPRTGLVMKPTAAQYASASSRPDACRAAGLQSHVFEQEETG